MWYSLDANDMDTEITRRGPEFPDFDCLELAVAFIVEGIDQASPSRSASCFHVWLMTRTLGPMPLT